MKRYVAITIKGLAEWFSSKFTLYRQGFDYSTPYSKFNKLFFTIVKVKTNNK